MMKRVYDGSLFCGHCSKCPVADYDRAAGIVVIHDPAKPESGSFRMSVEEFNALLEHARPVPRRRPGQSKA